MINFGNILEAAGLTWGHLFKTPSFAGHGRLSVVNQVYASFFRRGATPPAPACKVAKLPMGAW